ncbi:MAG: hypothetical protein EA381_12755 [Planctomycetaceae bacterium]|nr:MAG: hypothetical protein EA381_12755 [Planctomycetaceae bacterium]
MKRIMVIGLVVLMPTLLTAVGCSGAGPKESTAWKMPWSKQDKAAKPYPNPVRMVATWTPDTLTQSGRTPTRGFGGRFYFYDEKTRSVPVSGELTVHAFAEKTDGSVGEVKRYQFTEEQFTRHFSQSDLGASYSVWIPWDAVGGDQMRISLVPSFKSTSGKLVQGDMALVGLPGRRTATENIAKRPDPTERLMAQRDSSKSGLTTTTIPVRRSIDSPSIMRPGMSAAAHRIAASRPSRPSATAAEGAAEMPAEFAPEYAAEYTPELTPVADPMPIASSGYMPGQMTGPTPMTGTPSSDTSWQGTPWQGEAAAWGADANRPQRLGQTVAPVSAELPIRR